MICWVLKTWRLGNNSMIKILIGFRFAKKFKCLNLISTSEMKVSF